MCGCTETTRTILNSWQDDQFRYALVETFQICCQVFNEDFICIALFGLALWVVRLPGGRGPLEP